MKFTPLEIEGSYLIELQEFKDERGTFARQFCVDELLQFGIRFNIKQCNISKNINAGTLRGMHYQDVPFPENKIVSCLKGRVWDCFVDLRKNSSTYLKWQAMELSEHNGKQLFIPAGCAHGFITLESDSVLYYQLDQFFHPECYKGVRWNDPKLNISWPKISNLIINDRDANYELL